MKAINTDLLQNTLTILQLASETARARGDQNQAERLGPVAENLRKLTNPTEAKPVQAPTDVLAQSDFQRLIQAAESAPARHTHSAVERNLMVAAMAEGGMSGTDIARQMGITQQEVQLIINVQKGGLRGTSRP